jgi:hypothetical protein
LRGKEKEKAHDQGTATEIQSRLKIRRPLRPASSFRKKFNNQPFEEKKKTGTSK